MNTRRRIQEFYPKSLYLLTTSNESFGGMVDMLIDKKMLHRLSSRNTPELAMPQQFTCSI